MPYKFELNLQQTAALRTAIWFWERKEVKAKAAEFFRSRDNFSIYEADKKWGELTKLVVDEWNKDVLAKHIEAELIHIVKMIGRTIFHWFQYIKIEYKGEEEAINCIDEIQWTPYGTADAVKIFKSSWLNNPNLDITKVYNFACRYAISDHINELWDKIPRNVQDDHYKDIYKYYNQHILAYWKCCKDNDLPNLLTRLEVASDINENVFNLLYDLDRSTEENMLRLTVYQGHFVAMKYFWQKLTKAEKDHSVLKCARIAVLRRGYYANKCESTADYKMSQYVEIWIFLMNQMTNRDKKAFFNGDLYLKLGFSNGNKFDIKNRILEMLLCTWPWEKLFVPVLEDMLRYVDNDNQMDCQFLDVITIRMRVDHKLGYSLETSKYRCLLREVWFIIPAHFKRRITKVNVYFGFIIYLIEIWDLDSLNLIINDPELAAVRDQFIDFGRESYQELLVYYQFEKLDQLIEEVFKFEGEEMKFFKQKINPWYNIFKYHEFELADRYLDWQSSTPEERQSLKNNIDHMKLCKELINFGNFESFDKFLDWKFETIEERISCEEHLKSDIFVIRRVYDIWMSDTNIDDIKQRSSRFLDWVFESNEEIRCFKKEKLVNFENHQFIISRLYILKLHWRMNKFFSWCSLDDTEIKRIVQVIPIQHY